MSSTSKLQQWPYRLKGHLTYFLEVGGNRNLELEKSQYEMRMNFWKAEIFQCIKQLNIYCTIFIENCRDLFMQSLKVNIDLDAQNKQNILFVFLPLIKWRKLNICDIAQNCFLQCNDLQILYGMHSGKPEDKQRHEGEKSGFHNEINM